MFNKEESKKYAKCELLKKISTRKVGTFLVTISMLLNTSSVYAELDNELEDHINSENEKSRYEQIIEDNRNNKEYDEDFCNLYYDGKYFIDGKYYTTGNVYLAYTYINDELFLYLVCPRKGNVNILTGEKYNFPAGLIRLVDTTLFIELLKKDLLIRKDDIMQFDMARVDEIEKEIRSWDGKRHCLVPELDIMQDDLEIIKVKKYESK